MAELRASAGMAHESSYANQPGKGTRLNIPPSLYIRLGDFAAILAIPLAGSLLRQTTENLPRNLCFWILLSLITVILIESHGGYRAAQKATLPNRAGLAINCFLCTSIALLGMAILLNHPHILARRWTLADLVLTPLVIICVRLMLADRLSGRPPPGQARGAIVICYNHCPRDLTKAFGEHEIACNVSGILYLSPSAPDEDTPAWPKLPDMQALLASLSNKHIHDVIFIHHPAFDYFSDPASEKLISDLLTYPARIWLAVEVAPKLPDVLKPRSGSCKIMPIVTDDLVSSINFTKRAFDIFCGTALLLVFAPVLLIVACLVRASGPGPVIFRQTRTGAQGRQFVVFKFRTMTYDPEQSFAQAKQNDPRVTRIGRFLRRSSLDELLQLFNVIRGDMSLVGPRPHAPETQVSGINFENAVRLYRLRHRVKPGITGLAQIRGQRGETSELSSLEKRLASDLEYIQSWSLWLDISILLQTLPVLAGRSNAW